MQFSLGKAHTNLKIRSLSEQYPLYWIQVCHCWEFVQDWVSENVKSSLAVGQLHCVALQNNISKDNYDLQVAENNEIA